MILKVLKNRRFWFLWLTLSIIGGVVSYFIIASKDANLIVKNIYFTIEYRDNLKYSSIIAVQNEVDTVNYLHYFKDETKNVDFNFTNLPEGKEVYVLNFNQSKNLAKIAVVSSSTDRINGSYIEYWIWYKFLSRTKK